MPREKGIKRNREWIFLLFTNNDECFWLFHNIWFFQINFKEETYILKWILSILRKLISLLLHPLDWGYSFNDDLTRALGASAKSVLFMKTVAARIAAFRNGSI